jgi:hypothetical protein
VPQRRDPDPFAPVEGAVTLLLGFLVGVTLLFTVIVVAQLVRSGDSEVSIATIDEERACALVNNEQVPSATDLPQRGIRRDIASVHAERVVS